MAKKKVSRTGLDIQALLANENIIQTDVTDEIESAMLTYAIKTIVDRAIPDIRDGLKPVHRRVLYAAWEKGYMPNKKYVKNALIVGDTMGSYHPHGDGCLFRDTMILGIDGSKKSIEELYQEGKDQYVLCVDKDGNPKVSRAYAFRIGKMTDEIYHLKLSNGKEIKCTDNHKFLTKDLIWKRADELTVNDILYSAILHWDKNDIECRPSINMNFNNINTRVAYLAREYKFGNITRGNIIHHKDERPFNNHPDNLDNITKKEHDLHHKSFIKGLNKGRERMIYGDLKEQTIAKNSYLIQEYNKNQGMNKAIRLVKILQDKGLTLTEDNYNKEKQNYYNYPQINKMIKRGQINSFDELVDIALNTNSYINFNKEEAYEGISYIDTKEEKNINKNDKRNSNNMLKTKAFKLLMYLQNKNMLLTKENYEKYYNEFAINNVGNSVELRTIEELFGFYNIVEEFNWQYPYITSIEVEHLTEKVPMYDFSVDTHENMFIVTDVKDNKYSMIITHNSIYDVIVNMSQPWNYRYPLMDFQGNNGSVDGDAAAAMRYTEGRLDIKSLELLKDIEDKCVDFRPNYSDTTEEPEVLPALFPNFLCNGASGIATGYTTDIPSHQLGEVVDAIIEVLKNSNATVDDLMKHIKGPDFAGGAYLIKNSKIRDLYETGKASLTFRAKYEIENNEENDNPQIIINQLPPDINKPKLVDQLYKLCITEKKIPRVVDVRDESKDNGIRIVVELHKTAIPDIVINELYEKTALQKNNTYIMRAIVNQTPKVLSLKEIIEYYIEHRRDVVVRRTRYILSKTKDKLHIQEGLNLVTNNIKKAIDIIQNSNTDKEVKEQLMATFGLSDVQVNEVLEIKLRHLTKLNKSDILKLIADLKTEIANYENILSGQLEVDKVIISELKALKNKFNDERRTILVDEINSQQSQTPTISVSNEPIVVVLTSKNTIKQITVSAFEEMIKNKNLKERTEAFVQGLKCTMNDSFVLIFENGEYAKVDFGDIVSGLSGLDTKSTIKSIVLYDDKTADKCIVAMTKKGLIKKVPMTGLKARYRRVAPLFEMADDKIIGVRVITMSENNIITLATKDGLVHRFFEKSFKETSAGGKGINGISLMDDNEVIDFDITDQTMDDNNRIVLFAKHDDGTFGIKSMSLNEFKPKGRIAQGIKGIEYAKKQPGNVYGMIVTKDDFFVTNSKGNVTNIKLASLPLYNRYNKPDQINDEATSRKFFLE